MKKSIVLCALFCASVLFPSCEQQPTPEVKPKETYILKKVVAGKNESVETTTHYRPTWKGDWHQVPDVETVYYVVYQDGSYERVDMGRYTLTNVGDTVSFTLFK